MKYTNVKTIAEAELAGCLDIVDDPNNFELVRENLTLRIACYLKRDTAYAIQEVINEEASSVNVPEYQYVINELQYEFRVAKARGPENLNGEYETRVITMWSKHIIRRKDVDTALDFITMLKANRIKRKRTFDIK
jgi:hypothetical protein